MPFTDEQVTQMLVQLAAEGKLEQLKDALGVKSAPDDKHKV